MNKTSNLLTFILIVIILTVVGIVTYYGYSYFRNLKINRDALEEIEQFDRNTPTLTLAEYEEKVRNGEINESEEEEKEKENNQIVNESLYHSSGNPELDRLFAPKLVGSIRIPKTNIRYPIYTPSGEKVLEKGIGMLTTDSGLNKTGNTTLQGHNWRNWMFFSRNHTLKVGDSVFIKDNRGVEIEYVIYKKMTVKPSDSKYITRNTNGKVEVSLSTCTNAAKDRLILLAREK